MKSDSKLVTKQILPHLQEIGEVNSILCSSNSNKDIYDPYFLIDLIVLVTSNSVDSFFTNTLSERTFFKNHYSHQAFSGCSQDRFLYNDIPVKITYTTCRHIEMVTQLSDGYNWIMEKGMTSLLDSVISSEVLYKKNGWIDSQKRLLLNLPDQFWDSCFITSTNRMENALNDLGSAAFNSDAINFQLMLSLFIEEMLNSLFILNRAFIPPYKEFSERLETLPLIPTGLQVYLSNLTTQRQTLLPTRKWEIARKIVYSLFAFRHD